MECIDISQELLTCAVYPGDEPPTLLADMRMDRGDNYNLSSLHMGLHNGTHVDAPFHFLAAGATAAQLPLTHTVGWCCVSTAAGVVDAPRAEALLAAARAAMGVSCQRLLLRGEFSLVPQGAAVLAESGLLLLGCEGQSASHGEHIAAVHGCLLGAGVVLLEGLRLGAVEEGCYFLCAAPLAIAGADGAPCRAILLREDPLSRDTAW